MFFLKTTRSNSWISLCSVLALTILTSACGGTGTAKLQFAQIGSHSQMLSAGMHSNSEVRLSSYDPTVFKKKLIAAYLAEDVDSVTQNNIGNTSMFWLNTECADQISNCNVFSIDSSHSTWPHVVSSFFDFTNIAATNDALNSQGRSIDIGTYRYVRLEFCKNGVPADNDPATGQHNIEWSYGGETGYIAESSCTVTTALTTPIEVLKGDILTVTLTYSLAGSVTENSSGSSNSNCTAHYCFNVPTFTPSASK